MSPTDDQGWFAFKHRLKHIGLLVTSLLCNVAICPVPEHIKILYPTKALSIEPVLPVNTFIKNGFSRASVCLSTSTVFDIDAFEIELYTFCES